MTRLMFKTFYRSLRSLLEQLKHPRGFTLIEILVVVALLGILAGISLVALGGARASGRDAKRRADLEQIRSGVEIYRADCRQYPATLTFGGQLLGDGSSTACATSNTYISQIPQDPLAPTYAYYYSGSANSYALCTYLEQGGGGDTSGCGSCGAACNYKVTNP